MSSKNNNKILRRDMLVGIAGVATASADSIHAPTTPNPPVVTVDAGPPPGPALSRRTRRLRDIESSLPPKRAANPAAAPPKIDLEPANASSARVDSAPPTAFARNSGQLSAWNAAKALIRSDLSVISDPNNALSPLLANSKRIEAGFVPNTIPIEAELNPLHIEPLIDQAADLLDRAIRDRATYDDLSAKAANLALEMGEFADLDEIHEQEERAGVYDVPAKQSRAELDAQAKSAGYQRWTADFIDKVLTSYFNENMMDAQFRESLRAAWTAGLWPYSLSGQKFGSYQKHEWEDGAKLTVSDHSKNSAKLTAEQAIDLTRVMTRLQREIIDSGAQEALARLPGIFARSQWDARNTGFQRRRTLVARQYQDLKARMATEVDGALNYGKRLSSLRSRFSADFQEALARMRVAQKGLAIVYGYQEALPSDANDINHFDDCLGWSRRAIQWLIRFSRSDQSAVWPISIRQLVGDDAWQAGRPSGTWKFTLTPAIFGGMTHIRLRGLSAFAERSPASPSTLIRIRAQVPLNSTFTHLNGETVTVSQSRVPPVLLARVASRQAVRDPDVAGLTALYNSSPFGDWTVTARALDGATTGFSLLDDIVLDLHLAFRQV